MTVRKSFTASESDYADIEKKKRFRPSLEFSLKPQMCMSDNYQSFLILARRRVTRKKRVTAWGRTIEEKEKVCHFGNLVSYPSSAATWQFNVEVTVGQAIGFSGTQTNEQDRGSII